MALKQWGNLLLQGLIFRCPNYHHYLRGLGRPDLDHHNLARIMWPGHHLSGSDSESHNGLRLP